MFLTVLLEGPLWDRTWRWEPGTLVTLTYVTHTGGRVYILVFKKKVKEVKTKIIQKKYRIRR